MVREHAKRTVKSSAFGQPRERRYWALMCDPKKFDIDAAMANLEVDSWQVGRSDVKVGDRVIIWKSLGGQPTRGIIALGVVVRGVRTEADHSPYWLVEGEADKPAPRVRVRFVRSPKLPIWLDGPHDAVLRDLTVSRGQGLIFSVNQNQWDSVMKLIGGWPDESPEVADALSAVHALAKGASGQGFRISTEERKAIATRAMSVVEQHFRSLNWVVKDTSASESYDLVCSKDKTEIRVEVKGTTGNGASVLLTKNEVEHARTHYPHVALAVVSGIQLACDQGGVRALGGSLHLYQPWAIDEGGLQPLSYDYSCPERPTKS